MSNIPSELRYLSSHEWVRVDDDDIATIGITDHAQDAMGDLVFVETPEVGTTLAASDEAGVVESVKAASDIYSPVSGEVIAVNENLEDSPESVNQDPYGDGWMFQIKMSDPSELDSLLTSDDYADLIDSEDD
ncbi:MAG: glycine cleavage system protein GcvH [Ketobacteraceae bacterium]|nr:glycine cleavage system protein GcvH [Ketobacteraceae bacterium]